MGCLGLGLVTSFFFAFGQFFAEVYIVDSSVDFHFLVEHGNFPKRLLVDWRVRFMELACFLRSCCNSFLVWQRFFEYSVTFSLSQKHAFCKNRIDLEDMEGTFDTHFLYVYLVI